MHACKSTISVYTPLRDRWRLEYGLTWFIHDLAGWYENRTQQTASNRLGLTSEIAQRHDQWPFVIWLNAGVIVVLTFRIFPPIGFPFVNLFLLTVIRCCGVSSETGAGSRVTTKCKIEPMKHICSQWDAETCCLFRFLTSTSETAVCIILRWGFPSIWVLRSGKVGRWRED